MMGARGKGSGLDGKSQAEDTTKSDVPSTHLTEVDREWFNIRIRDLEDKLTRWDKSWLLRWICSTLFFFDLYSGQNP